jgi:hypothetical protein
MTAGKSVPRGGRSGQRAGGDLLGANSEIGRKLKQLYEEVASETVPDRFSELLAQLEKREGAKSLKGGD